MAFRVGPRYHRHCRLSRRLKFNMDADRNLLFGVLALQADLLDSDRFVQACTLWTTRKEVPLP